MDPADIKQQSNNQSKKTTDEKIKQAQDKKISVSTGKEQEAVRVEPRETPKTSVEVEVAKEVKETGVEPVSETIEIPPDIKKLGVKKTGQAALEPQVDELETVKLPISDYKVVSGLHFGVTSTFRWLAEWCVKKLKKAHIKLKVIHGKIVRVKT